MIDRKVIQDLIDDTERAFYASHDIDFYNIKIAGPLDGESAFKESSNIEVRDSHFELRYPFWHNTNTKVSESDFTDTSRAGFWYCEQLELYDVVYEGVKAIRECKNVKITDCTFNSEEFGWRSENIEVDNSKITGFYGFFQSQNIKIKNMQFKGKYSFQYVTNLVIDDSELDTKDAFWHTKNAVVRNCQIIGEYLGWYSENLTLINCHIKGTQPLCYCKNLTLVDCTFEDADLAFEYSEVNGSIKGGMVSIKNPLKGQITIDEQPEMIIDENDRSQGQFSLNLK